MGKSSPAENASSGSLAEMKQVKRMKLIGGRRLPLVGPSVVFVERIDNKWFLPELTNGKKY